MAGDRSDLRKTLSDVHDERLKIVALRKEIEHLRLKYDKFRNETKNISGTFQNLIDKLKIECNRMTYMTCLQSVAALRLVNFGS